MIADIYKKEISSVLMCGTEQIFLYWKGRVALYAILKAMGVAQGDEIIVQGYTCVVVPNAIFYTGAKPVYVDICAETYNMDPEKLEAAITSKTKVIICQNTFGLSSNLEKIIEIANRNNIFTIEDCTHGFGGNYSGKPNGSFCDAAFYSTQWNKPFSTGIGGFLVVNNSSFLEKVQLIEKDKVKSSFSDNVVLILLILFRKHFLNKYTYNFLVGLYRLLSKMNLIIGSNRAEEISDIRIPKNYLKDVSFVQAKIGIDGVNNISEVNNLRKKNALEYTEFLKSNSKNFVKEKYFANHLFLKYPLLVNNREVFTERARKAKIILGDWFFSPIYPIHENLERWNFLSENYPIASEISKKIVNLPTETDEVDKVISFLKENIVFIE